MAHLGFLSRAAALVGRETEVELPTAGQALKSVNGNLVSDKEIEFTLRVLDIVREVRWTRVAVRAGVITGNDLARRILSHHGISV